MDDQLQLGLALPNYPCSNDNLNSSHAFNHKKRTFSHPPDNDMLPTLSLLPLTPSHHDHHHDDDHSQCSNITNYRDEGEEEEEGVVGWPPVNYWRKKLRVDHAPAANHIQSRPSTNTSYVKVKMEGVGIARKVDLAMHRSFHTLNQILMDMFAKCHQQSNTYELAYQDKEGDWLLAQDVPWRNFVGCAQRLKLVKSSR